MRFCDHAVLRGFRGFHSPVMVNVKFNAAKTYGFEMVDAPHGREITRSVNRKFTPIAMIQILCVENTQDLATSDT
jgi:hypothetical protein